MADPFGFEEAFELLVEELRECPLPATMHNLNLSRYGCDIIVSEVLKKHMLARRGVNIDTLPAIEQMGIYATAYDAAAELCRTGVIRFGPIFPYRATSGQAADGNGFSLTQAGRTWVHDRRTSFPRSPGAFMQAVAPLASSFGAGFLQRSEEALRCYRGSNYLAACVMCGAAAESILLSIAIAKEGDEEAILECYRRARGRKAVVDKICFGLPAGTKVQLNTFVGLLSSWRDEAAHGVATTIDEPQANLSILQLFRFAHFAQDHWAELTA